MQVQSLVEQTAPASMGDALGPTPAERKTHVLLVEDDDDMRRLVAAVLDADGYDVVQAGSGVAMLRRIEAAIWNGRPDYFDAVVADIQMPDLTALEVLEALRLRDISTPAVLMTAYGSRDARAEARALGAVTLLAKPLDWDQLRAAVRKAVRRR